MLTHLNIGRTRNEDGAPATNKGGKNNPAAAGEAKGKGKKGGSGEGKGKDNKGKGKDKGNKGKGSAKGEGAKDKGKGKEKSESVCLAFQKDECTFGDACRFKHVKLSKKDATQLTQDIEKRRSQSPWKRGTTEARYCFSFAEEGVCDRADTEGGCKFEHITKQQAIDRGIYKGAKAKAPCVVADEDLMPSDDESAGQTTPTTSGSEHVLETKTQTGRRDGFDKFAKNPLMTRSPSWGNSEDAMKPSSRSTGKLPNARLSCWCGFVTETQRAE